MNNVTWGKALAAALLFGIGLAVASEVVERVAARLLGPKAA